MGRAEKAKHLSSRYFSHSSHPPLTLRTHSQAPLLGFHTHFQSSHEFSLILSISKETLWRRQPKDKRKVANGMTGHALVHVECTVLWANLDVSPNAGHFRYDDTYHCFAWLYSTNGIDISCFVFTQHSRKLRRIQKYSVLVNHLKMLTHTSVRLLVVGAMRGGCIISQASTLASH